MPKYRKEIGPVDDYLTTGIGGGRRLERFTRARYEKMAETLKAMLAAGLRIPTPWGHTKAGPLPVDKTDPAQPGKGFDDASNNAGWWEKIVFEPDPADPEKGRCYAEMDIPLAADAEKINTVCKEVSPIILDEFTDGKGRVWKDAPVQLALVTNPIVPGQKEFEPIMEGGFAIAMSHSVGFLMGQQTTFTESGNVPTAAQKSSTSVDATDPSMADVLKALASLDTPLILPDDTTPENLPERIIIACTALASKNDGDDNQLKPGETPVQPPIGVALSALPEGFTMDQAQTAILKRASDVLRDTYGNRVKALIDSERVTKAYADTELTPLVTGFSMSFKPDGTEEPQLIDKLLKACEALPAPGKKTNGKTVDGVQLAHGESLEQLPADDEEGLAEARKGAEKMRDEMLAARGFK